MVDDATLEDRLQQKCVAPLRRELRALAVTRRGRAQQFAAELMSLHRRKPWRV